MGRVNSVLYLIHSGPISSFSREILYSIKNVNLNVNFNGNLEFECEFEREFEHEFEWEFFQQSKTR